MYQSSEGREIAIVSTGDELVPPDARPESGQIRDINTYTIAARVTQCGAQPLIIGLVPDEYAPQLEAARNGIDSADMLVFSAGSSLSSRDMTATVFNKLGEPGVLLHGISIKPGKPTIVAVADGKPLFGLPGNPVSALVVFDLLVAPAIRVLSGTTSQPIVNTIDAILTDDVPSESGREDYVPVKLSQLQRIPCRQARIRQVQPHLHPHQLRRPCRNPRRLRRPLRRRESIRPVTPTLTNGRRNP